MNATANTRDQLLDYAQALIGSRGCNGFSYRDLAQHVGVKTSSIHYYFPCKDDLVREAIERYSEEATARVYAIDATLPAPDKLDRYAELLEGKVSAGKQLCIGGMMASDLASLPESVQCVLRRFFLSMESWLEQVLKEGLAHGTLRICDEPGTVARAMFAAAQGSMLTARLFQEPCRIREALESLYERQCDKAA
ncbi:TetR/AcrR family transcriptional regulator [Orrella sp. JC864]|uniref:TetR/AcrR family transcriptional regulator n=1 Tax=Orrella sp. JC864 TaxID=3120298 RepID=UPI0030089F60